MLQHLQGEAIRVTPSPMHDRTFFCMNYILSILIVTGVQILEFYFLVISLQCNDFLHIQINSFLWK